MNTLNIFTTAFNDHSCLKYPPKNFKWVFNSYPSDNSPVIYFDDAIFRHMTDKYTGPKYGWLGESSEIISSLIMGVTSNKDVLKLRYKNIFTNDRRIIKIDPDFFLYNPPASNMPWIDKPNVYEKTKLCSYITSFKQYTSGHIKRMELFEKFKNDSRFAEHIYGRQYKFIPDKLDGLKDYMFSVVIENSTYPKYYTEKITDCFATGTIPIYYGDKSIGEDFNLNGIIFLDELESFDHLTPELYNYMLPLVEDNYKRVLSLKTADDFIYESVMNDQIKHT
jgi:hypothetical protein